MIKKPENKKEVLAATVKSTDKNFHKSCRKTTIKPLVNFDEPTIDPIEDSISIYFRR
jgi:hypothetical protein